MTLIFRYLNEPSYGAMKRDFLAIKKHESEIVKKNHTNVKVTAFNTFRALMKMVSEDLSYITKEQLQHLEDLADQGDASIGAIYESYLHTEDLEDLVHSCLLLLRYSKLADCTDGTLFAYQVLEKNRMEHILRAIKVHLPEIDIDEMVKTLYRERSIITLYESMIGTEDNQTPESLIELGKTLQKEALAVSSRIGVFSADLPQLCALPPKKDISEIRAELFSQMASLDVSLSTKEHQLYKLALDTGSESQLQATYKQFEKIRKDTTKKIELFNSVISDFLKSRFPY